MAFFGAVVGDTGLLIHLSQTLNGAALEKDQVGQRRLSGTSVTGDGEIVPSSARISQVFDDMPNSLYIEMKSDEATIEFEISEVDMAAATARAAVTGTLPSGEVMAVPGSCTIGTIAREETDA